MDRDIGGERNNHRESRDRGLLATRDDVSEKDEDIRKLRTAGTGRVGRSFVPLVRR